PDRWHPDRPARVAVSIAPDRVVREPSILAASGASTTVGLFLLLVRDRRKGALRPREVLLLLVLLGPYGFQLSAAVRFVRFPHDLTAINEQAPLLFGFFAFAVGRDWELLGAETKSG